jgi:lactoylglutathione lyase
MQTTLRSLGAITLFVEDPQASKTFYANVFEREAVFENDDSVVFELDNVILNLLVRANGAELVEPGPVAAPGAGSQFQFTIWVEDTDDACAELERKGVELRNGPINRRWGQRTAAFADPDGHVWEVAASLR